MPLRIKYIYVIMMNKVLPFLVVAAIFVVWHSIGYPRMLLDGYPRMLLDSYPRMLLDGYPRMLLDGYPRMLLDALSI